jgi:curved DNA binding protein
MQLKLQFVLLNPVKLIGKLQTQFKVFPMTMDVSQLKVKFLNSQIGMVTHQILRNVLDGPKQVILNPSENQRKDTETITFSEGEAYSIDVVVSSGEGKPKVLDTRTTIYKRNADAVYNLKMKASRAVFSDVLKNYGSMAFTLRSFEDEKKGRLGIMECASHGLVTPYSVLSESNDAHVAHLMFTVLLMSSGPLKITSFPWDESLYKSSLAIKDESIVALLKTPVRASKKSKKKKAKE